MSKLAMLKIATNKEMRELGFRQLFPVHDEIIGECPIENKDRCAELMSQMMIEAGAERVSVPMKCDVAKFINWERRRCKIILLIKENKHGRKSSLWSTNTKCWL